MDKILRRTETFARFRGKQTDTAEEKSRAQLDRDWRRQHGRHWRLWSVLWWLSLAAALLAPCSTAWLVSLLLQEAQSCASLQQAATRTSCLQCDFKGAWANLGSATQQLVDFPSQHNIEVPDQIVNEATLHRTDVTVVRWQLSMSKLFRWILDHAPVDEVSDNTLDIEWETKQSQGNPVPVVRGARVAVVNVFFMCCAGVYFIDNIHLAVVLLQLNLMEVALALRIKALNDALQSALHALWSVHMKFALLPMATEATALGQQQLCLQKLEVFYDAWERTRLGQTMRAPFSSHYMTLSLSLIFSLVAATTVRCIEIVIGGFYPELPRFSFIRRIWRSVMYPFYQPADDSAWVTAPPTRTCSVAGDMPVKGE